MRKLLCLALCLNSACDAPDAIRSKKGDAGVLAVDASRPAVDAGTMILNVDAGPDAPIVLPDGGFSPASLIVLAASESGTLVSWTADDALVVIGEGKTVNLGTAIVAAALRPNGRKLYAVTQTTGKLGTLHFLSVGLDGQFTLDGAIELPKGDVVSIAFDRSGQWLFLSTLQGFYQAKVGDDKSIGSPTLLVACDATSLTDTGRQALLGVCNADSEAKLFRFDFSPAAGASNGKLHFKLLGSDPVNLSPINIVAFDTFSVVQLLRQNGSPKENRLMAVNELQSSALSSVNVRAPDIGSESEAYATALARHPRLEVVYSIQGGSYGYNGNHLAVVGRDAAGSLEVRQYVGLPAENLRNSRTAAVTPNGKWLLVGSSNVSELRTFPIDQNTGKLGAPRVPMLVDTPLFVGFLAN